MPKKLWQKSSVQLHPLITSYTVGDDYLLDYVLLPYDVEASKAHAQGLQRINVLTKDESDQLCEALDQLLEEYEAGGIEIHVEDEDCHTVIENYLVKKLGDTGKKIHTGRSRNDQVLTALRLFMRHHLDTIRSAAVELAEHVLVQVETYQHVPLPGYTHTQQAMLSSVGHYYAAILEALLDDVLFIDAVRDHINISPLGSAAGYGVSFPLDRTFTTEALGFDAVQLNSLYCQNSRGKFESLYLEALTQIMLTLGRVATDMLFYTSQECNFFSVDENLVTGSSIMPQKRNLDGLEVLRGNVGVVRSYHQRVQNISANLISGYHRDLQLIKQPIMLGADVVLSSLHVAQLYVQGLTPNQDVIEQRITTDIFMADRANELVTKEGMPFRDAYKQAAETMDNYTVDYQKNLADKQSLGAPGNLQLDTYRQRLSDCS